MEADGVELQLSEALDMNEEKKDLQDPGELQWVHAMAKFIFTYHLLDFYTTAKLLPSDTPVILSEIFEDSNQGCAAPLSYCLTKIYFFICFVFSPFFSDYRYRKDEIFKRLKVTTFAQLVSFSVYFLAIL